MEIDVITTLITTVGFPIACVIGLGVFFYKAYQDYTATTKEREEKLYGMIKENQEVNKQLVETNASFVNSLNNFTDDIQYIKSTVNDIKERM